MVDIIVEDTTFAISSVPNPKWSDAPDSKALMVMGLDTELPNRGIKDERRHPGQPDSGSRWWASSTVRYTYSFKGREMKSEFPGIKVTNCYINLKSRPSTDHTYGENYVKIGIPYKTATNLVMALNTDSRHTHVLGGCKSFEEDGCMWTNCSLKYKAAVQMIIDDSKHHILDSPNVTMATIKKEFNSSHTSCRSVMVDPEVKDYYLCDLILVAYGSTVLPKGATPANTEDFKMEIKRKGGTSPRQCRGHCRKQWNKPKHLWSRLICIWHACCIWFGLH